jgi:membrane protein required for colicin V production
MAGLNHLDYAIVAIIALGAFYGLTRGVLRMATSLLSVGLGLIAASTWYQPASAVVEPHMPSNPSLATVIGFIAVFLIVAAAIEFVGRRIVRLAHIINLNWLDRLGGAIFGAALAAAFAGIDVVLLTAVLPPDSMLLRESLLAPRVLAFNDSMLACVPAQVKDLYEQKHKELIHYWSAQKENPAPASERAKSGT